MWHGRPARDLAANSTLIKSKLIAKIVRFSGEESVKGEIVRE